MDPAGRVALLTGGRRIGSVVAVELARLGMSVALTHRNELGPLTEVVGLVSNLGGRALLLPADLRDPQACERVVEETARAFGRLDVLINMASVYRRVPLDEISLADWDDHINTDLRAAWLCTRAAVPLMRHVGEGRIVNVSDWTAPSGRPRYEGYLPYYVAKAGIVALTEALALELARDRILVNAVALGPILPPDDLGVEERANVERATPVGRWAGPLEVAKVVRALIDSDFMTGETIRVDGGRHLR